MHSACLVVGYLSMSTLIMGTWNSGFMEKLDLVAL